VQVQTCVILSAEIERCRDCATLLETTASVEKQQAAGEAADVACGAGGRASSRSSRTPVSQRLSKETVAALVSDYRSGASLDDLQRSYLLSRGSVQKLLRERGAKRRRRSLTQDELAVLVERYEADRTIGRSLPSRTYRRPRCRMRWHELV
jgi:hypothetical protein